jgi:hypothetical protein
MRRKSSVLRFALGFYSSQAPISIRYWATDRVGIDVGAGFKSTDLDTASTVNFWLETALPIQVFQGDRSHFYVRPGVIFGSLDDRDFGTGELDETWSEIQIYTTLGAEVFFGDNFSVEAAHGVVLKIVSPPDQVTSSSLTSFDTLGRGLTEVGFRFYF